MSVLDVIGELVEAARERVSDHCCPDCDHPPCRLCAALAMFDAATSTGTERPSEGQGTQMYPDGLTVAQIGDVEAESGTPDFTAIHDYCYEGETA